MQAQKTYSVNLKVDIDGKGAKQYIVDFFCDSKGKPRIIGGTINENLPLKYRGTLLDAVLSQIEFGIIKTGEGFRLTKEHGFFEPKEDPEKENLKAIEYEYTIKTKDGGEGIPFGRTLFFRRRYYDLRNILLTEKLDGATIEIKINDVNCELRNSDYNEITTVVGAFNLYNLDGSQSLVYKTQTSDPRRQFEIDQARYSRMIGGIRGEDILRRQFIHVGLCHPHHGIIANEKEKQWQLRAQANAGMQPLPGMPMVDGTSAIASEGLMLLDAASFPESRGESERRPFDHSEGDSYKGNDDETGKNTNVKRKPRKISEISNFKAVIFDLDGVVVDSEPAHLVTFNKIFVPMGIKINKVHWRRNYTGIGSIAIVKDVFKRQNIKKDVMETVNARADVYQKHIERHGLPQIPGFKAFHSFLNENGIKTIVASGGHRPHIATSLSSIGLPRMKFVGIEDVKMGKPAPDTFLKAAEMLGVKPDECIVIEDSLSGAKAAANANMVCVALSTTLPATKLKGKATLVVNGYQSKRLKAVIRSLLERKKRMKQAKRSRR